MLQYMETVSQGEAENIRKTIQDLFRQTCILQVKCDPATLVQHDNPRYQVCLRHREFIADYLSVLDCELVHDPQEHIFRITGDGVMTERMSLMTTKLVILLKMIYRDKIMGEGLHATTTNLAEIREYGKNTNLITRRLTGQEWNDALVLMKTHQMIELPGAVANLEDFTPIYIYSTVNVFCSAMDINELVRTYQDEVEELLTEEEKEKSRQDLQQMLDYVDMLNRLDTSDVEPLTHIFPIKNVFREDVVLESTPREELMKNAPKEKDGQFLVPKTIG